MLMPWKNFDYVHYLQNHELQPSQMLQPIFEAIENGFQSIEDGSKTAPTVRIIIHRDVKRKSLTFGTDGDKIGTPPDVASIEIVDSGVGFTSDNWKAFETLSTSHRKSRGGKGMGRLLYCVPFGKVEFDSTYIEGEKLQTRKFSLARTESGTTPPKINDAVAALNPETTVRFTQPTAEFRSAFPRNADGLARRIVKHFFKRLSMSDLIKCIVIDSWKNESIDVGKMCREEFILQQESVPILYLGQQYRLTHVRVKSSAAKRHELLICGQTRVVVERDLGSKFIFQKRPINADDGSCFYAGFLEGEVLERALREDRLSFNLPEREEDDDGQLGFEMNPEKPSIESLMDLVGDSAELFLKSFAEPIRDDRKKRIEEFCRRNPVYRPLLSHRLSELMRIPSHLTDQQFSEEVGAIYHRWKAETKANFATLTKSVRQNKEALANYSATYRKALRDLNELAFHELAEYVVDRRVVIDFLWDRLKSSESGKFADEDAVHDVFFPRRTTSADVDWEDSQLWLIDERLMMQDFVASDLPLNKHTLIESDSTDRPDVAVYHDTSFEAAYAFAEGQYLATAVTLIEFKRPMRDNYTDDENPIEQVFRYIRKIRASKERRIDGHIFKISDATPIHVHVICHIVDSLTEQMGRYTYVKTQDGQGMLLHAPLQNAFIQVITFEKLIADARTRQDAFFRKLGLPTD